MTLFQRIKMILFALLMIAVAVMLLMLTEKEGLDVVLGILSLGFAIKGIKDTLFTSFMHCSFHKPKRKMTRI